MLRRYERMLKPVRCEKKDGRKFEALYQGDLGKHHLVWTGTAQILIKPEIGEVMEFVSQEEGEAIVKRINELIHSSIFGHHSSKPKEEKPKEEKKVFRVSEMKAKLKGLVKKEMSDFEILTADIATI